MVKFSFKVEEAADYEFYSDHTMKFEGMDMTIDEMFERFEMFLVGIGYHQKSIQKFYTGKSSYAECGKCSEEKVESPEPSGV